MTDYISRYIDNQIIREHAYKGRDGLSLGVCDLPDNELSSLIEVLLTKDPITRDIIEERVQELINARIPFVEARDNVNQGLKPIHDSQTGEVMWVARAGNY